METFLYVMLVIMVACNIGICIWMVIKSRASDAAYEKALDEIYGRKR
jgi:hypothetical protein